MQCWRMDLEYEGTRFSGWQIQPHCRTIQGDLTNAAQKVLGTEVKIAGAGRTDAGVHAMHQVAHLKVVSRAPSLSCKQLRNKINDLLPHDINVIEISPANPSFHARHDASSRYYLYQIATRRSAFGKPFVWWVRDKLDVEEIARAWKSLAGRHDFKTFADARDENTSSLINVYSATLSVTGDLILLRIGAERFLWKMVRRLVGVVVEIGRGNSGSLMNVDDDVFTLDRKMVAALTAPPSGLFLEHVLYAGDPLPGTVRPLLNLR